MLCAISGEAPQVPVASRRSGHVYEKRLIEAYIAENGKDPVTGEELTTEDLVDLRSARVVRPRPPTLTSIPSLLSVFQNEWDALALQTYTLKQHLAQTRQELSTALYQQDAAVRVIARLTRERDEARDALAKITVTASGGASNGDHMLVDQAGIPSALVATVDNTQERLSKTRRKRAIPERWATAELVGSYHPVHSSEPLDPGCKFMALMAEDQNSVLLGGTDGVAKSYSAAGQRLKEVFEGPGGAITDGIWYGNQAILATVRGVVQICAGDHPAATLTSHAGSVTALALHPSERILASVGVDKSYVLYDLISSEAVTQVYTDSGLASYASLSATSPADESKGLTAAAFHPDGHLFAAGSERGQVKVFDVKTGSNAANFDCGSSVKHLAFSENGTWLAVATKGESRVSIWDLRKAAVIKTLEMGGGVESVAWDYHGQFLAGAGPSGITVHAYAKSSKQWSEVLRSAVPAIAVRWGEDAQSLIAVNAQGAVTVLRPS